MTSLEESQLIPVLPAGAPVSGEVAAILARPYTRVLERGPEGWYTAHVAEFPGAIAEGETPDEALSRLDDAFAGIVETMMAHGDPIPLPQGRGS